MSSSILQGKRILITQADAFMGPVLCEVFAEQGALVIASTQSLIDAQAPASRVSPDHRETRHEDIGSSNDASHAFARRRSLNR